MRAAPGLDQRGLRILGARDDVTVDFWNEWTAPPADLVEEALRRWLLASGRFGAVTAPGSRLRADLILEAELTRLQAEPVPGIARASLSALLLANANSGEARVLGQVLADGTAPCRAGRAPMARSPPATRRRRCRRRWAMRWASWKRRWPGRSPSASAAPLQCTALGWCGLSRLKPGISTSKPSPVSTATMW